MLGVIIVSYKNPERTIDFVNNQLGNLKPEHVVVVVNNSSTMDECEYIANAIGGVACAPDDVVGKYSSYVVNSTENLGFAKGNNLGVRFLMQNNPCSHLLFSNDDIIIDENTDLSPMIDLLDSNRSIGAIGPDVVGLDGRHQSPHYKAVSPYRQIGWMILPFLRKKRKTMSDQPSNPILHEGNCYWISGAFFMMRSDVFISVDGFDPDTFLYSEEPILAERLRSIGKTMYFYPDIKVTHHEGGTTKDSIGNNGIMNLIIESNCIYYRKYLKTPKIIISLYKWLAKRQWNIRVKLHNSRK